MRQILILSIICLLFAACTESPYKDIPNIEPEEANVLLSEILSSNSGLAFDEYGDTDDYIIVQNYGDISVNLESYGLTDEEGVVKYYFPDTTLISGGRITVWCDSEPEQGDFHADFRISASGEWIALLDPEGSIIDSVTVPALEENTPYTRADSTWIF